MTDEPKSGDVPGGDRARGGGLPPVPAEGAAEDARPGGRRRARRALRWTGLSLAAVMVVAGGAGLVYYRKLQGNIDRQDVDRLLGRNRPKKLTKAVNILLIGSDSRAGENAAYGSTEGARADTTILLHLSPGGRKAIGMSFPRDLMVHIPTCTTKDGGTTPAQFGMINAAYAFAGPSCTWRTIESLTQIHIDHFVVIDFSGFKRVVDALGGVEVCLPHAVDDPKAKLHLKAGRQTVHGAAALGYVRTRTGGLGDGSDLDRIDRQKRFMSAVVQKATSSDMLADPTKLVGFLNAATKSISTDRGFGIGDMRRLAGSIKEMEAGGVRFVTVPFGAYPADPNRVALDTARAGPLFEAIRMDTKLPDPAAGVPAPAKPSDHKKVKVRVYNGVGDAGGDQLAGRVADQLKAEKFTVLGRPARPEKGKGGRTRILYGGKAERKAAVLAPMVPGVKPAYGRSVPKGVVHLVIGKDWKGLRGLTPTGAREIRADENICKGD